MYARPAIRGGFGASGPASGGKRIAAEAMGQPPFSTCAPRMDVTCRIRVDINSESLSLRA
jgi:hypothetical protein